MHSYSKQSLMKYQQQGAQSFIASRENQENSYKLFKVCFSPSFLSFSLFGYEAEKTFVIS